MASAEGPLPSPPPAGRLLDLCAGAGSARTEARGRRGMGVALALLLGAAPCLVGALLAPTAAGDAALAAAGAPGPAAISAAELAARVDPERALEDVRRLSGATPLCTTAGCITVTNRLTGSADLARATDYLAEELSSLGYGVSFETWTSMPWFDRNLFATSTGVVTPTDKVYIVAHVDGVGGCPNGRCPGADDNASGTAAVLELARALAELDTAPSVVFLFSTGEEQGCLGVNTHLASLSAADLASIRAVVNLDMVGYDSDDDGVMNLYYGDHAPSLALARRMEAAIVAAGLPLQPVIEPGCG